MATWYRTRCYRIEPVEVVKETAKQVTVRTTTPKLRLNGDMTVTDDGEVAMCDSTYRKSGSFESYFPTREEAALYLLADAEEAVASAEQRLNIAKQNLEKARAL